MDTRRNESKAWQNSKGECQAATAQGNGLRKWAEWDRLSFKKLTQLCHHEKADTKEEKKIVEQSVLSKATVGYPKTLDCFAGLDT